MGQVLQRLLPLVSTGSGVELLSYYRTYAGRCRAAARNSPTAGQRAELEKMVRVWKEFADLHEQLMRAGVNSAQKTGHLASPGAA